jgi:hypothetical protein
MGQLTMGACGPYTADVAVTRSDERTAREAGGQGCGMRPIIRRECHGDDCSNERGSEHSVRPTRAADSRFQRSDCLALDPMGPSTLRSAHSGAHARHPTHHPCTFGGIEWGRGARGLSGKFWVRAPQRGCGTIGSLCGTKPRP